VSGEYHGLLELGDLINERCDACGVWGGRGGAGVVLGVSEVGAAGLAEDRGARSVGCRLAGSDERADEVLGLSEEARLEAPQVLLHVLQHEGCDDRDDLLRVDHHVLRRVRHLERALLSPVFAAVLVPSLQPRSLGREVQSSVDSFALAPPFFLPPTQLADLLLDAADQLLVLTHLVAFHEI